MASAREIEEGIMDPVSMLRATAALTPESQEETARRGIPFSQQLPPGFQPVDDSQFHSSSARYEQAQRSRQELPSATDPSLNFMAYMQRPQEEQAAIAEAHMGYNPVRSRRNPALSTPRDSRPYTNPEAFGSAPFTPVRQLGQPETPSRDFQATLRPSNHQHGRRRMAGNLSGQHWAVQEVLSGDQSVPARQPTSRAHQRRHGDGMMTSATGRQERVRIQPSAGSGHQDITRHTGNRQSLEHRPALAPIGHERREQMSAFNDRRYDVPSQFDDKDEAGSTTSSDSDRTLTQASQDMMNTVLTNLLETRAAATGPTRSDGFMRFREPHPHEIDSTPGGSQSIFDPEWNPPRRIGRDPRYPQVQHEGRSTYFEPPPQTGRRGGFEDRPRRGDNMRGRGGYRGFPH